MYFLVLLLFLLLFFLRVLSILLSGAAPREAARQKMEWAQHLALGTPNTWRRTRVSATIRRCAEGRGEGRAR